MRVFLSLAAVLLPGLVSADGPRPSTCPDGFRAVPLERSGGTFTVTEDALTRGSVCQPDPVPHARPVVQTAPPAVANAIRQTGGLLRAAAPSDPPLTMNPPRPAPAGVSTRFVERTYDDFDRIESEKVPLEDGGLATIRYTYWPDGRRKTLTDALGRVTFYEYDGRARLSRVTANQGLPDEHVTTYTYWPDGLLRTITKPNGVVTSYDYDRADRLTSVIVRAGPTVLLAYEYTYDPNGNRLTQVETNGGQPETTTYTYDDLNRLETVTYPDGVAVAYEYDPVGNRTRETTRSAAGVIVSDKRAAFDAINRLSSITDSVDPSQNATLAYDRNGNLLSKTTAAGTEEYSYDTRDFLVETRSGASITAHFAFDAFGRRYLKVGLDGTRQYLYDDTSTLHELDGDDTEVAKYEYGGDRLLSLAHRGEPRRYYEQDGLGTPVALTDASGSVVARYHLDAWGRYRFPTELDASANRFGFTGYLFDQETDLYYAKARFYDPELGRFTTQDSVLGEVNEPPSLNRYAYAWANPTRFTDPSGHCIGIVDICTNALNWAVDRSRTVNFAGPFAGTQAGKDLNFVLHAGLEVAGNAASYPRGLVRGLADAATPGGSAYWSDGRLNTAYAPGRRQQIAALDAAADPSRSFLEQGAYGALAVLATPVTVVEALTTAPGGRASDALGERLYARAIAPTDEDARFAGIEAFGEFVNAFNAYGALAAPLAPRLASASRVARPPILEPALEPPRLPFTSENLDGAGALELSALEPAGYIGPERQLASGGSTTLTREQVASFRGTGYERGEAHNQYLAEWTRGRAEARIETQLGGRVHDVRVPTGTLTEMALEGKNYLRWRTVDRTAVRGEVTLTDTIRQQTYKDVLWVREGRKAGVHRLAQWDFAGAPPNAELASHLKRWGITFGH